MGIQTVKTLSQIYHPITATPLMNNENYCEITPCDALRPYIRCFWGTKKPVETKKAAEYGLVIPDTCMDLIFSINYTKNQVSSVFCALDEHSYRSYSCSEETCKVATFGIRFYAWTAKLFAEDTLKGTKNRELDPDIHFYKLKQNLLSALLSAKTIWERIRAAELLLLKKIYFLDYNTDTMLATYEMIRANGNVSIRELSAQTVISQKKLERIFNENIGASPKTFLSLVRYQLLWQDMVYNRNFNMLDTVEKYGYYDQAHLLHDFYKRHLMYPKEALLIAQKK